jgi:ankyrin repeat protein
MSSSSASGSGSSGSGGGDAGPTPTAHRDAPVPVSVCGLVTELEDVGRVVALAGYGDATRRLPFVCKSLHDDDELLVATGKATYGPKERTRLMSLSRLGDVRRVTHLLRACGGTAVNVQAEVKSGYNRHNALTYACMEGRSAVARVLVEVGKLPVNGYDLPSPLELAAKHGHVECVRTLLDLDAEVNGPDEEVEFSFPLLSACTAGHADVARLLLNHGARTRALWDKGMGNPLTDVVGSAAATPETVRLLIKSGMDVEGADDYETSPIIVAANSGRADLVRVLLDKGANVDISDENGETALYTAAELGYKDVVKVLLEHRPRVGVHQARAKAKNKETAALIEQYIAEREAAGKPLSKEPTARMASVVTLVGTAAPVPQ